MRNARLLPGFGVLAALVGLLGCGNGPAVNAPSGKQFPRWDGHAREVWDDNIDPSSVGMQMDGVASARGDAFLRERAQTSELVSRLRVQTVTIDSVGDDQKFHLGMQVGFPTLASDPKITDKLFEVEIRGNSRSFELAKAFDARLRGHTFIGFVRRFSNEDGEMELHWHFSADNAEVAGAVKEALALREISGS